MRRQAVGEEFFAAPDDWPGERAEGIHQVVREECVYELAATLGDQVEAIFFTQTPNVVNAPKQYDTCPTCIVVCRTLYDVLSDRRNSSTMPSESPSAL